MPGIFISYRRSDAQSAAGRLDDNLRTLLPEVEVFRDVKTIEGGADFLDAINAALQSCGVVLAIIGPRWATVTDAAGSRRLDNPADPTRMEIATALARSDVRVIPVLVEGATMPTADQLPDDLKDLARRNAVELSDRRWTYDVGHLIATVCRALGVEPPAGAVRRPRWLWPAIAAVGVLVLIAGFLWLRPPPPPDDPARVVVPAVVGMDAEDAVRLLTNLRLAARQEPGEAGDMPPGRVIGQVPAAETPLPPGGQVTLRIAVPARVVVPELVGRPRAEAEETLRRLGLEVGIGERVANDDLPPDTVLRQEPAGGESLAQGDVVRLVLSTPRPPVRVPNVIGRSLDQAQRALDAVGLRAVRGREAVRVSPQDRAGHVLAQEPPADDAVPRGSRVRVEVFGEAVRLPNVIGYEARRAVSELRAFGVSARSVSADVENVRPGVVVGQEPSGGTEQPPDRPVTITVARARPAESRTPAVQLSPEVLSILRSRNQLLRPQPLTPER